MNDPDFFPMDIIDWFSENNQFSFFAATKYSSYGKMAKYANKIM
jgi:hypothetical protein